MAVGLAAPGASPVLELQHLARRFPHEGFHRVLIAKPVAPGDGVVGVRVQAVAGLDDRSGAALGGDGVTAHGIYLRDHRHAQLGVGLNGGDGRAQARAAAAYDEHVTGGNFHEGAGIPSREITLLLAGCQLARPGDSYEACNIDVFHDTSYHMKTTVEIPDSLLEQARRLASKERTTVRALVEEGLRRVVADHKRARPFKLRKVSFKGNGLQPQMAGAAWQQIRDAAYQGRGA